MIVGTTMEGHQLKGPYSGTVPSAVTRSQEVTSRGKDINIAPSIAITTLTESKNRFWCWFSLKYLKISPLSDLLGGSWGLWRGDCWLEGPVTKIITGTSTKNSFSRFFGIFPRHLTLPGVSSSWRVATDLTPQKSQQRTAARNQVPKNFSCEQRSSPFWVHNLIGWFLDYFAFTATNHNWWPSSNKSFLRNGANWIKFLPHERVSQEIFQS